MGRRLSVRRGGHLVLVNLSDEPWDVDVSGEVVLNWAPDVVVEDGRVSVPERSPVVLRG